MLKVVRGDESHHEALYSEASRVDLLNILMVSGDPCAGEYGTELTNISGNKFIAEHLLEILALSLRRVCWAQRLGVYRR